MTRALWNAMVRVKSETLWRIIQFHIRTKLNGVGWGGFAIFTIVFWTIFKMALYMSILALLLAVEIVMFIPFAISGMAWIITWPVRKIVRVVRSG